MTLLVDLPPEIEARVHEVAQAEGLDVSALMREAARSPCAPVRSLSFFDRV